MKNLVVVHDMKTLRALEKAGHIKLHEHTGKKVRGPFGDVVAWYVDTRSSRFNHRGKEYVVKYVDGCFHPFVYVLN